MADNGRKETQLWQSRKQSLINNGTTSGGNIAIKNINLNNLKLDATEQQLIDAGNAVAALVSLPLVGVRRIEDGDLTNEE